jgi:hypothetical protein
MSSNPTAAPASAKRRAVPRPIPEAAPVITAAFPASEINRESEGLIDISRPPKYFL